ncbi:MAG: hypothetical protein E7384_05945 [Ruminococcaceae bacterium]|nr:hypothetical protein [Oscillospiraceae bacterium]
MNKYTALIMDLKKSRRYSSKNRNEIQDYIYHVVQVLNIAFRRSLEKDVFFSAGDELQGLFSSVEASYLYFRLFSMLVAPVEIRAGIGVGEWDVIIKYAGTTAQDGSAYHNARRAINATEESLGYSVLLFSGEKNDIIINSLFNSTALIINKQSEYQNQIMLLSELLYPINAYDIININVLKDIVRLILLRSETVQFDVFKIYKKHREPLIFKLSHLNFESRPIDAIENTDTFFVTEGKVRGLPMQLSEILGVTRQSADKTIKAANIYEARNLAVVTLKYLKHLEVV